MTRHPTREGILTFHLVRVSDLYSMVWYDITDNGCSSAKRCKLPVKNQLPTASVPDVYQHCESSKYRDNERGRSFSCGYVNKGSRRHVTRHRDYEGRELESRSSSESINIKSPKPVKRTSAGGTLVTRLTGRITRFVRRDNHQSILRLALHDITRLHGGSEVTETCSNQQDRDYVLYLTIGVPGDVVFEEGSGVIMYNIFEAKSYSGDTLYRTPTKVDEEGVEKPRTCHIWMRKDGFLITNRTKTLGMRTERELAELAHEESVGFFQETEIEGWVKFDLNSLKKSNSLDTCNEMVTLLNGSRDSEKARSKDNTGNKEDGSVVCVADESSSGEDQELSDDQISVGSIWEGFTTLIPMALDTGGKPPILSHRPHSNYRGKDKKIQEPEKKGLWSSDLWNAVASLGSLSADLIENLDTGPAPPPEPKSFVLSDDKSFRHQTKPRQIDSTKAKDGDEQGPKTSSIDVIIISDDEDDGIPLT